MQGSHRRTILAWTLIVASLLVFQLGACSVYKASNQPSKRNLGVLKPGTSRDHVIAELGAPVDSEQVEGGKKDIFTFIQGYSKSAKISRAVFHGVADVFTVGLWEVAGTPIEGSFDGKKISVSVIYDSEGLVNKSETLSISDP
jgi:hypothetical protein